MTDRTEEDTDAAGTSSADTGETAVPQGDVATDDAVADAATEENFPKFSVVTVSGISFELPSPTPILSLTEDQIPYRRLDIPIALPEAQSLAQALFGVKGARPGTHELFADVLRATATDIVAARLTRFDAGVYYAELDLVTPRGQVVLDCRISDAVILSLRQGVAAPILCAVAVLEEIGE